MTEEPFRYQRKRTKRHSGQQCGLAGKCQPILTTVTGQQFALQHSQHKQRQRDGQHCCANGHIHRSRLLYAVTVNYRIGHQRVAAEHRAEQRARLPTHAYHARDEQA